MSLRWAANHFWPAHLLAEKCSIEQNVLVQIVLVVKCVNALVVAMCSENNDDIWLTGHWHNGVWLAHCAVWELAVSLCRANVTLLHVIKQVTLHCEPMMSARPDNWLAHEFPVTITRICWWLAFESPRGGVCTSHRPHRPIACVHLYHMTRVHLLIACRLTDMYLRAFVTSTETNKMMIKINYKTGVFATLRFSAESVYRVRTTLSCIGFIIRSEILLKKVYTTAIHKLQMLLTETACYAINAIVLCACLYNQVKYCWKFIVGYLLLL